MTEGRDQIVRILVSDDLAQEPRLPRPSGWHLCDNDLSVIDTLHATCVEWLAYARDAKRAGDTAAMMEALEAIAAGGNVTSTIEVSASRRPDGGDGLTATILLTPHGIELQTTEWVWMSPEQGHDHACTMHTYLTPSGGFDRDKVNFWLHLSGFATDEERTELTTSRYADPPETEGR